MPAETFVINVDDTYRVSALLQLPAGARVCYVFAHGAGAGMQHKSLSVIADELERLDVATLRYQFPYMERGSRRTDPPQLCHATVRAAVAEAARRMPGLVLVAGGRSFGGRMTSQAQAIAPLERVRGLVFLGFPLHPAGRPSDARAQHLSDVTIPMLFLQGTRDELAELSLLQPVVASLGARARLHLLEHADHSFHVQARSGRKDDEVIGEVVSTMHEWILRLT